MAGQVTAIQTGLLDGLLEPYTGRQKLQTFPKGPPQEDLPGLVASVPTYYQGVAGSNPVAGLILLVKGGLFGFLKIT